MENSKGYTTVQNALKIILLFIPANEELRVGDVIEKLGLHKSTVSRLLNVLSNYKFLQYNNFSRKYSLGKTISELGMSLSKSLSFNLVNIARPHIDHLRNIVGETIAIEILSGKTSTIAYKAVGLKHVQLSMEVGATMPIHVAAGARVMIAFLPEKKIDKLLNGDLKRFTPNTVTDIGKLKSMFKKIKADGVAYEMGELNEEGCAAAAPIFNYEKVPVAAVVLTAPLYRSENITNKKAIDTLKETADRISSELFYPSINVNSPMA